MKNILFTSLFLLGSLLVSGQEHEQERPDLIVTDSTWGKEMFTFPLGFAREIMHTGMEEAQFPKGWSTVENPFFWTYTFAWHIDGQHALTARDIEADLKLYFDGLMGIEGEQKADSTIQYSSTIFIQKEQAAGHSSFVGKIKTWDRFTTKKPMTLYVSADQYYCEEQQKVVLLFRFSPKEFGHEVWDVMQGFNLNNGFCQW